MTGGFSQNLFACQSDQIQKPAVSVIPKNRGQLFCFSEWPHAHLPRWPEYLEKVLRTMLYCIFLDKAYKKSYAKLFIVHSSAEV